QWAHSREVTHDRRVIEPGTDVGLEQVAEVTPPPMLRVHPSYARAVCPMTAPQAPSMLTWWVKTSPAGPGTGPALACELTPVLRRPVPPGNARTEPGWQRS